MVLICQGFIQLWHIKCTKQIKKIHQIFVYKWIDALCRFTIHLFRWSFRFFEIIIGVLCSAEIKGRQATFWSYGLIANEADSSLSLTSRFARLSLVNWTGMCFTFMKHSFEFVSIPHYCCYSCFAWWNIFLC